MTTHSQTQEELEKIESEFAVGKERLLLNQYIPYLLGRTVNSIRKATAQIYIDAIKPWAALNNREFRVLVLLSEFSSLSPAQAANLTGMEKATVTRSIMGLKKHGLVDTMKNTRDGRSKYIVLTQMGAEACDAVVPKMKECGDFVTGLLTEEEKELFIQLIAKIEKRIPELSDRGNS